MKKYLLSVVVIAMSIVGYAQLTEGKIHYEMTYSSDDPEMAAAASMMAGSSMTVFMKGKFSRADLRMGSMMEMKTIIDTETKDALMLMDISMMGMKNATKFNLDEMEEEEEEEMDVDIQLIDETRTILDYTCKKALVEDEEGNEMIFWYSEDISFNTEGNRYMRDDIPGQPLEFEVIADGMTISFKAMSIDKSISSKDAKSIFNMNIPEGYEEKSMEELNAIGR